MRKATIFKSDTSSKNDDLETLLLETFAPQKDL